MFVFLVAFFFTGLIGIELWPLTGWKLFSQLRKAHAVSWQVVTVDAARDEKPIPFDRLPRGYHGTLHVLKTFEALDAPAKDAVCRTWEHALAGIHVQSREILIYRIEVHRSISPDGGHAPTIARTPRYRCLDGRVEEIRGAG